INCLRDLNVEGQASNVFAIFQSAERPIGVRSAALEALSDLSDTNFPAALEGALRDPLLRSAGLKLIPTNAAPTTISRIAEILSSEREVANLQAAYAALGRIKSAESSDALKKELARLAKKEVAAEVSLDLL